MAHMERREFIAALGGAAAWPLAARAQQPTIPMIGYLSTRSPGPTLAEFRQGLSEAGYFDGRNVAIDFRSAEGQYDRLPLLAADLVRRQVSVIVGASPPSALAAKAATSTIPIVFVGSGDPVEAGLVASFNRPGGNVTGISLINVTLGPKRLELLREMVPKASVMALLVNSNNPNADAERKAMSAAAHALGQALIVVTASSGAEIERAFATLVTERVGAVVLGTDPLFNSQRDHIVTLAAFHALPAIYDWSEFAEAGGLMSYGTSLKDAYRQGGVYVGRILKGEQPADLPVMQSTRFELVINLKTAKALGLEIPPTLLARADEVIE